MFVRGQYVRAFQAGVERDRASLPLAESASFDHLTAAERRPAHLCTRYGGSSFAPRNAAPQIQRIAAADQSISWIMHRMLDASTGEAKGRRSRSKRTNRTVLPQETMSAVTMPNIPAELSAWLRMWQWNAQTPGSSASTIASHRSPGATLIVSQRNGCGSG
jgi:hypothetical protein